MRLLFQHFCKCKNSLLISNGSIDCLLNLVSFLMPNLNLLIFYYTFCDIWKLYFSLNSWSFILFDTICCDAKPCFINLMLFKLLVAFEISLFGLTFFSGLSKTLPLKSNFLNSLVFCSATLPPQSFELKLCMLYFWFGLFVSFYSNSWSVWIFIFLSIFLFLVTFLLKNSCFSLCTNFRSDKVSKK